jgi:hypothetical protein
MKLETYRVDGFETPYGMELLATVHWTAGEKPGASFEEVVQAVQGGMIESVR